MYEVPDFGAPRMARGSGSLAQPLSALRAAPTTFPTPATPSVGGSNMDPLVMGASAALSALGGLGEQQLKGREFKLNKQAQNQRAYMGYLDAINAQKRRVGETPGKQYLLGQMMQRLGLDPSKLGAAKELEVRPVSGNFDPAKTFADQYGGKYAQQYQDSQARNAKPPAPQVRLGNSMGTNNVADMMRRAMIGGGR